MRKGLLAEQHVSDLIWVAHLLDYTGLLQIFAKNKDYRIFFKDGSLVFQKDDQDPFEKLEEIAGVGIGRFTFYDNNETTQVLKLEPLTEKHRDHLVEYCKNNSGFSKVIYSKELMDSRVSASKFAGIPDGMSDSTLKLRELCANNPTISLLYDTYQVSPKIILEVTLEGIQAGILNLLSFEGRIIPKPFLKKYTEPISYQFQFFAELIINNSLTAKKGRIHVSQNKLDFMNEFPNDKSINARIGAGYFDVEKYKLKPDEVMISKSDYQEYSSNNDNKTEVTLIKGV